MSGSRDVCSGDIQIEGLFVSDDKVALTRAAGEWHPLWHIIATTAFPLIYAVYPGIAEAAPDIAVGGVVKRDEAGRNRRLLGEMDSALWSARVAHDAMVAVVERNAPSAVTVNDVMFGRRAVEVAVLRTVEAKVLRTVEAKVLRTVEAKVLRTVDLAMQVAGGPGFYRAAGLERRFRDVQGARYHPMRREVQQDYAGALALGESVASIY